MSWDIEGKHVLLTGGTSGIGQAAAEELARRGARVTITARDPAKGQRAAAAVREATGAAVDVVGLDLSSLDSVRSFAAEFTAGHDRLDILINNAGTISGRRRETADGLEWTFAVNHLGPFLLTHLLTDLLVASAPARVVTVSSEVQRRLKRGLDLADLQLTRGYSAGRAYATSKLANILMTVELDRRLVESGVRARALHPGVVATGFGKGPEGSRAMSVLMTLLSPVLRKPAEGAATTVLLATADDDVLDRGLYWSEGSPKDPGPAAADPEAAAQLWVESCRLVGLADPPD